jgi:hypothetical protein
MARETASIDGIPLKAMVE